MINCKDIYGNTVTQFIFNEDGTVIGIPLISSDSIDIGEAQYGVRSYPAAIGNPLSAECCRAFNFTFDYNKQKCYYRVPCTGINDPQNNEISQGIEEASTRKLEIESELSKGNINSISYLSLNNEMLSLDNTIKSLENQLKPTDIHLIFGAQGRNPVLFSVPGAQGDLTLNELLECNRELTHLSNQIAEVNDLIEQHKQAIAHILQIINDVNNSAEEEAKIVTNEPETRGYSIYNLQDQLNILNTELVSLEEELAELNKQYDELNKICNPTPPACALNVEFDYLLNFDCEELLNCASGDASLSELLNEQHTTCMAEVTSLFTQIRRLRLSLSELATQISSYQLNLQDLEQQLAGNIDPIDVYLINQQINNINAELVGLSNQYNQINDELTALQDSYNQEMTLCNQIQTQINILNTVGNLINNLQGIVFYLTINKKVLDPITSTYIWETVYTEEFFRIDDLLTYITNNQQTGIYFSGDRCDELIENIGILLGDKCNVITPSTFNSSWLHFSTTITDPNTILEIVNEEITFGIIISYDNPSCEYCFMIDNIEMNQICEKTEKTEFVVTKCPSFELRRVIDNKKSWMTISSGHTREFDLTDRDTYYKTSHYKSVVNSKEIDLTVDPASAIENDVYNYTELYPCILSGNSGQTNYMELMSTNWDEINTIDEFRWIITSELIDVKSRKVLSGYPVLKSIYERYLSPSDYGCTGITSNAYTYCELISFSKLLGVFWIDLIEQVIPSTTIWGSVYTYRNSIFDSQKFRYKRYTTNYCVPTVSDCGYNSGSTTVANVIIEDLSKEVNNLYPECFIASAPLKSCNYIETIDYHHGCEYFGKVVIINGINSGGESPDNPINVITGDGVIAAEDINYYDRKS